MEQQNNFTTVEQSKRLLELGVPADSADCYINYGGIVRVWINSPHTSLSEYIKNVEEKAGSEVYIPCWSVGQLIWIYNRCCYVQPGMELDLSCEQEDETYLEYILHAFEYAEELSDFSKLED